MIETKSKYFLVKGFQTKARNKLVNFNSNNSFLGILKSKISVKIFIFKVKLISFIIFRFRWIFQCLLRLTKNIKTVRNSHFLL